MIACQAHSACDATRSIAQLVSCSVACHASSIWTCKYERLFMFAFPVLITPKVARVMVVLSATAAIIAFLVLLLHWFLAGEIIL